VSKATEYTIRCAFRLSNMFIGTTWYCPHISTIPATSISLATFCGRDLKYSPLVTFNSSTMLLLRHHSDQGYCLPGDQQILYFDTHGNVLSFDHAIIHISKILVLKDNQLEATRCAKYKTYFVLLLNVYYVV